jgi:hypothetical protein
VRHEPAEIAGPEPAGGRDRDWPVGVLAVVLLLMFSPVGRKLPEVVQTVVLLMLVALPFFLTPLSWWRFSRARRDEMIPRWRLWVSFCGCVALSLAFVIIGIVMFEASNWISLDWSVGSSLVSILAGTLAGRPVRFPLMVGGLVLGGIVVLFPIGIL